MSSEPIARVVRAEYIGPRVPESLTVSAATTKNERPKKPTFSQQGQEEACLIRNLLQG